VLDGGLEQPRKAVTGETRSDTREYLTGKSATANVLAGRGRALIQNTIMEREQAGREDGLAVGLASAGLGIPLTWCKAGGRGRSPERFIRHDAWLICAG